MFVSKCFSPIHYKQNPAPPMERRGKATHKRDSVFDDNLSGPSITLRFMRHSPLFWLAKRAGLGLAPSKDLAVSPPLFYPYSGAGPVYVRMGSLRPFRAEASLFAPLSFHSTAVSRYFSEHIKRDVLGSVPTFLSPKATNRLSCHNNYTSL